MDKEFLGDIIGALCLVVIFTGILLLPLILPAEFLI